MTALLAALVFPYALVKLYVACRRLQIQRLSREQSRIAAVGSADYDRLEAVMRRIADHLHRFGVSSRSGARLDELIDISFRLLSIYDAQLSEWKRLAVEREDAHTQSYMQVREIEALELARLRADLLASNNEIDRLRADVKELLRI